jgi:hypothetical protein
MQIDELRSELTRLADEIGPFEGDVHALHRRERRRRTVTSALVAVVIVVVGASAMAVLRHRDEGAGTVTAAGSKEVSSADISHVDVIVIPASPAVQHVLGSSPLVARYALAPRAVRLASLFTPSGAALCALERSRGFAVQASSPGSDIAQILSRDLAGRATVYDVSDSLAFADFGLNLRVGASSRQVEAVRAALTSDPDVRSFRYLTPADEYEAFKKLEGPSNPVLVQTVKPSAFGGSFQIMLRPGSSVETTAQRYAHLDGVVDYSTPRAGFRTSLFSPTPFERLLAPCRKP